MCSPSRARYKEGESNFLEVLDAERADDAAARQATEADATAAEDLIAVYKAMGGGWSVNAPAQPAGRSAG